MENLLFLGVPILKHIRVLTFIKNVSSTGAGPRSAVGSADDSRARGPGFDTFVSPSADSRRAVVSYWRKYVHEVLVNS